MKKFIVILTGALFFIYGGICLAGSPKGLEKKAKTPKGFSQGEKSGWEGETPKGWEKLSDEEKEQWRNQHKKETDDRDMPAVETKDSDETGKSKKGKQKKNKGKKKK